MWFLLDSNGGWATCPPPPQSVSKYSAGWRYSVFSSSCAAVACRPKHVLIFLFGDTTCILWKYFGQCYYHVHAYTHVDTFMGNFVQVYRTTLYGLARLVWRLVIIGRHHVLLSDRLNGPECSSGRGISSSAYTASAENASAVTSWQKKKWKK